MSAPRFRLRWMNLIDGGEGWYSGCETSTSAGPWAIRGEAEDVAAWLNRRSFPQAFYFVTDRSPLDM